MCISENARTTTVDVLTAEECYGIAAEITRLQSHWIKRDNVGLYTLGAAAYKDSSDPLTFELPKPEPDEYYRLAAELNPFLLHRFASMYEAVRRTLEAMLGHQVRYYTKCAVPGFHIYLDAEFYSTNNAHFPHVDRQYRGLTWDDVDSIDFRSAISFTLPVELPVSGGGIYIWDLDLYDVENWGKEKAKDMIRRIQPQKHTYELGKLFLHSCHVLHRAAGWHVKKGDRRITLQGHGLFFDDVWNLYW